MIVGRGLMVYMEVPLVLDYYDSWTWTNGIHDGLLVLDHCDSWNNVHQFQLMEIAFLT